MSSTQPSSSLLITANASGSNVISGTAKTQPCAMCRRNFAKYTCPTCNAPYCSLQCYRSESHSQCTEPFYRKQIELEIKSEPTKSVEEKRKMMELLKKFEDESLENDELGDDEDDEDEEDALESLSKQFENVDIESISTSDLWNLLPVSQRTKFLKTIQNPESEVVKDLLSSEAIAKSISPPWWELEEGIKPTLIEVPPPLLSTTSATPSKPLIHNIFALTVIYAYILRTFGVCLLQADPGSKISQLDEMDSQSILTILSHAAPFLVDRRSTLVHTGVDSALTDVISRLTTPSDRGHLGATISSSTIKSLLRDCIKLLTPELITPAINDSQTQNPLEFSSHHKTLLMLSDLSHFFHDQQAGKKSYAHVNHKLAFYSAHIASLPSSAVGLMLDVIMMKVKEMESNEEEAISHGSNTGPGSSKPSKPQCALIEELS
ncbi:hypothetical protein FRC03_002801 [Tulasnella sp. 419]|nr:hypothetical protein FRC03_002801 [Tulasnella sp. 419]